MDYYPLTVKINESLMQVDCLTNIGASNDGDDLLMMELFGNSQLIKAITGNFVMANSSKYSLDRKQYCFNQGQKLKRQITALEDGYAHSILYKDGLMETYNYIFVFDNNIDSGINKWIENLPIPIINNLDFRRNIFLFLKKYGDLKSINVIGKKNLEVFEVNKNYFENHFEKLSNTISNLYSDFLTKNEKRR